MSKVLIKDDLNSELSASLLRYLDGVDQEREELRMARETSTVARAEIAECPAVAKIAVAQPEITKREKTSPLRWRPAFPMASRSYSRA